MTSADVPDARLIPIGRERAARLGARGAFGFFSLPVDEQALCEAVGDSIPDYIRLVDATDSVPYARSISELCRLQTATVTATPRWLLEFAAYAGSLSGALLRAMRT